MNITTKNNDPIANFKLVDAYFRWALLSIIEVGGEAGLDLVLKSVGMEKFRQVYATDKLEVVSNLTFKDYSKVIIGLINVFGEEDDEKLFHSGRVSARHAMRKNGELFHPPKALRNLSGDLDQLIRASLDTVTAGYQDVAQRAGQEYNAWFEEHDGCFYYHLESCAVCAGVSATEPICAFFSGSLMESLRWFTGKYFDVQEVACRSMNDPACVWKISK